jgi:hypothetical protein
MNAAGPVRSGIRPTVLFAPTDPPDELEPPDDEDGDDGDDEDDEDDEPQAATTMASATDSARKPETRRRRFGSCGPRAGGSHRRLHNRIPDFTFMTTPS